MQLQSQPSVLESPTQVLPMFSQVSSTQESQDSSHEVCHLKKNYKNPYGGTNLHDISSTTTRRIGTSTNTSVLEEESPTQPDDVINDSELQPPSAGTISKPAAASGRDKANSTSVILIPEIDGSNEPKSPLCPVSDKEWFSCIQEVHLSKPKFKTNRGYLPNMWNMVGTFATSWKTCGWYRASLKNHSEFKNLIIQHILFARKKTANNLIPQKYLETVENQASLQQSYLFYSKEEFLVHAQNKYKVNLSEKAMKEKSHPNDILRLFGIAFKQMNRDDLEKLGRGKALVREDLDGPVTMKNRIFIKWAKQFNDPDLEFSPPQRCEHLPSYLNILNKL